MINQKARPSAVFENSQVDGINLPKATMFQWQQDKLYNHFLEIKNSWKKMRRKFITIAIPLQKMKNYFKLSEVPTFAEAYDMCKCNADKISVYENLIAVVTTKSKAEKLHYCAQIKSMLKEEGFEAYILKRV